MNKKMALTGLRGLALAPVTENTMTAYKSTAAKPLPSAGALNRTPKEKKQDIYYDDELYAQINKSLGEDAEIRLGEMTLAKLAELGLGTFDQESGVFEGRFTPKQGTYSLRGCSETIGGEVLCFNWRAFDLTGIRFDNFTTMGESAKVAEVIITGVFKKPAMPSVHEYAFMLGTEENKSDYEKFLNDGETFPKV